MAAPALRVQNLSKRFHIGAANTAPSTLVETLAGAVTGPLRRLGSVLRGQAPEAAEQEFWALNGVSFDVDAGEVVGVIGRNGAGKSTLLKVLSRITEPTSGSVSIAGRVGSLLEVGSGFHPELTGRENIFLNGAVLGMSRSEIARRFDEIVAFSEVEKFLDTPVKHYSSGMYMRLAFGVAAHLESEILLVDEVLAVGDSSFQRKCLGKMGDVARHGRTVLFVSHNLAAVSQLCSRAIFLAGGQVVTDGPVASTLKSYLSSLGSDSGVCEWEDPSMAPQSQNVRLEAVRVLAHGRPSAELPIDEEIQIEVDFTMMGQNLDDLCVNMYLLDAMGMVVLSTANTPWANAVQDPWFGARHESGRYRTVCTLPADFLNEGRYYITIHLVRMSPVHVEFSAEQVTSFSTLDRGTMRAPGMGGAWHGAVRVRLPWRTRALRDGDFQSDAR